MTAVDDIKLEIKKRINQSRKHMKDAKQFGGVDSPGFNQAMGSHDVLFYLLEWIEDEGF